MALTLSDAATLATLATVLGGGAVALGQWRQAQRRHRDEAAIRAVQSVQSPATFAATRLVCALPDDLTPAELEARGEEARDAVNLVQMLGETLGYQVYRRVVPLEVIDEMAGGGLRLAWRKLKPYAEHTREREGSPNPYEWFQWLVERMDERAVGWKARGAHVALKDWRP